jgi:2-octaprenyl-6-methoxyphenol hydroxylase
MLKYDVLIVGAGLNGLVAALALGGRNCQTPLKVAVVDRIHPDGFAANTHDSRASALTAATQSMLQVLKVWDALLPFAQNMSEIIVTDAKTVEQRPSLLSFAAKEKESPAALVENALIFKTLLNEIANCPQIEILAPEEIAEFHFGPGLARVQLKSGQELKTNLIVGADGRKSPTRAAAGIAFEGWDYPQSAITLTVGHALWHEGRAEEHFSPTGVFAILPLTGKRSSIVWTEPHSEAQRICALSDEDFLAALTKKFGTHLGQLHLLSPRHAYPLSMYMAKTFVGPRVALLGDAAHVVHPLAGLGLNLGFKDAAALAEAVMKAAQLGQDIGGDDVLQTYMRWRRFDSLATAGMLDGLNRLFANDNQALRLLRQVGLRLVDQAQPLKDGFMREASGQLGDLPRLMRGLAV